MDKRKRAIFISSLFVLSVFLMITVISPTSFMPAISGNSTCSSVMGTKTDGGGSYIYWWDVDFHYRQNVTINNSLSPINVVNRPLDVFLTFNNGTCYNNSIRVQYWNGTSWLTNPIPAQVWNKTYYSSTSYYQSLTLTFYVNVSSGSIATYYVYYDNENQGVPSYPAQVTSNYTSGTYTITGDYYTASITRTQNGGKVYVSTNRVSGNEWSYDQQMDWSPEYAYAQQSYYGRWDWTYYDTSGHPANSVNNTEQGPLFVMFNITTNMSYGSDIAGKTNVIYRFYSWGWTTETSTNFTKVLSYEYSYAEYHGNELRFDTRIMSEMEYKDVDGTVYYLSNFTWNGNNIGKALWLAFWNPSNGQAVGTLDLKPPSASKGPYNWYYSVSAPTSGIQKWQRVWPGVSYTSGDWVHENYAIYIWDGRNGSTPFENFANSMRSTVALSVGNQETVRYTVNVQVQDSDNMPLSNANVSVYKDVTLNDSTTTDSNGDATLYLYGDTFNLTTTWSETFEGVTGTPIFWKTYTNTTTIVVNNTLNNAVINIKFNQLTSLYAHLVSGASDFPAANMSLYQGSPPYNDSQNSNDTGWAVFHVDRANYDINITYAGNPVTINTTSVNLTSGTQTIAINCNISSILTITNIYCVNSTFVQSAWGTDVNLKIYWNSTSEYINSTEVGGYVSYTLINATDKSTILPYVNITAQGISPDIYYIINLPSAALSGGQYYTVYVIANDSGSYLMADKEITLYINPASASVDYASTLGPFWWGQSDIPMLIHITYNGEPVTGATVGYSMISVTGELKLSGLLAPTPESDGYYFLAIPKTDISNPSNGIDVGVYTLDFMIQRANFTSGILEKSISISPANTTLSWSAFPSNEGFSGLNITFTVLYNDSVGGNIISDAAVSYQVQGTSVGGSFFYNASVGYQVGINSSALNVGVYVMSITARRDNYEPQNVYVPIIIEAIPTELLTSSVYLSDLVAPNIIYFGQSIQVENNIPFVIVSVRYDAPGHSPVPGAAVTVNGIPMVYTGDGNYLALIPTYGLPPGAYPLFVTAEGGGYAQQNLVFLLSVKETTVLIPFTNARVPLTMFLAIVLTIAIACGLFLGYYYVGRVRIPAIIRRIDQLTSAMDRGVRVNVKAKAIPREKVLSRILVNETSFMGVEPRVKGYEPKKIEERLVPLLVESGMGENEAYVMVTELKKATPSKREKLLQSVGIPEKTSARVLQIIEEQEEKSELIRKPTPAGKPKKKKSEKRRKRNRAKKREYRS